MYPFTLLGDAMLEASNPTDDIIKEDIVRHVENRKRYEAIYDSWSEESPAAMNQRFSNELRELLTKGGNQ